MKITTKGRYGLRAIVDLAVYSENEPVSIHSIAERQGISDGYLEQLIAKLKKAGLVESTRGATGGYRLAKNASEISVGDILRALEGSIQPIECPAIEAVTSESGCANEGSCVTKGVWKKIADSIEATVDHITLQELKEQGEGSRGKCGC